MWRSLHIVYLLKTLLYVRTSEYAAYLQLYPRSSALNQFPIGWMIKAYTILKESLKLIGKSPVDSDGKYQLKENNSTDEFFRKNPSIIKALECVKDDKAKYQANLNHWVNLVSTMLQTAKYLYTDLFGICVTGDLDWLQMYELFSAGDAVLALFKKYNSIIDTVNTSKYAMEIFSRSNSRKTGAYSFLAILGMERAGVMNIPDKIVSLSDLEFLQDDISGYYIHHLFDKDRCTKLTAIREKFTLIAISRFQGYFGGCLSVIPFAKSLIAKIIPQGCSTVVVNSVEDELLKTAAVESTTFITTLPNPIADYVLQLLQTVSSIDENGYLCNNMQRIQLEIDGEKYYILRNGIMIHTDSHNKIYTLRPVDDSALAVIRQMLEFNNRYTI